MLRFRKGWERTGLVLDAKKARQPVTSGLRDWVSHIPVGDVERFEAAVSGLLDELGYARAVPLPRSLRPIVVQFPVCGGDLPMRSYVGALVVYKEPIRITDLLVSSTFLLQNVTFLEWSMLGSNHRPLPCEGS